MEQKKYIPNIPETDKKRIVIVGSGFAGLKLAKGLLSNNFQIILLDKNNYHQFQPLLYQVATAGLEPSAISFPLRKITSKREAHTFPYIRCKRGSFRGQGDRNGRGLFEV